VGGSALGTLSGCGRKVDVVPNGGTESPRAGPFNDMKQLIAVCAVALAGCTDDTSAATSTAGQAGGSTGGGTSVVANSGAGGTVASNAGGNASAGTVGDGGTQPGSAGTNTGGMATGGSAGQASGGGGGQPSDGGAAGAPSGTDAFGIPILRPSKVPGYEWNSLHWGTGELRTVDGRDPSDPTGWSIRRGDTSLMEIDGAGVLAMGGAQPRFYVQPQTGETEPFFRDIEFTGYYRRTANDGASNAGFLVGVRAHVNGHGDVDHCLASTYYLVFRNSGTWIFDKELDHPADSPGEGGSLPGGAIPVGKWIGMKYLAYNLPGDTAVKLEAYIDVDSNGDGTQPESWQKLGETVDDGNWSAPVGDCGYPENTVVTEGGGVVFMRNTDVGRVEYTKLSWREIVDAPLP
jgi:hypothetical protein